MDLSNGKLVRTAVLGAAFLLLGVAAGAHAASWEYTRKNVIDPINTALHRHLPRAIQARDLDAVLEFYATDTGTGLRWEDAKEVYPGREEEMLRSEPPGGPEPIRERYGKLLELLVAVERAEGRVHRVYWTEADETGTPAELRLLVRGRRADGARVQVDQYAKVRIVEHDGHWQIVSEEVTKRELVARKEPRFENATEAAGIANVHTNETSPPFRLIGGTAASSGAAVGDVDGDGCEDVFLSGSPDAALYRNRCDGTFEDVTTEAGLPRPYPAAATGSVFFDYDNDGDPDLYVSAIRGGDRLFRNEGKGRFEDVTKAAKIPAGRWASMPAVADYDRDGHLDVYVIRMGDHETTAPEPNYDAWNGLPNTLLRNRGDGTFEDVTERAGLGDMGWGLAGAWSDYDDDGWPDVLVGNEFGVSCLYRNKGDGTFEEVGKQAGTADRAATMGVTWGDYDNDGDLDLFLSNMYANSRWALFHPDFPAPIPWPYRLLSWLTPEVRRRSDEIVDHLTRGSTLLRNDGGKFTDVSDEAGVRDAQWGWATEFIDYDNDGRLDLYAQNGFITGELPDDV